MNGTHAAKARRNLTHTQDRQVWQQARSEDHPMRYRLYCQDGAYNLRCDRITLLAEMTETKPYRIERLQQNGKGLNNTVENPCHIYGKCGMPSVILLEVES